MRSLIPAVLVLTTSLWITPGLGPAQKGQDKPGPTRGFLDQPPNYSCQTLGFKASGTTGPGRWVTGVVMDLTGSASVTGPTAQADKTTGAWELTFNDKAMLGPGKIVRVMTTDSGPPDYGQAIVAICPARPEKMAAEEPRHVAVHIDEPDDNAKVPAGTVRVRGIVRPRNMAVHGVLIEPATAKRVVALGKTRQHGPTWVIEFENVTTPGTYLVRVHTVLGKQSDQITIRVESKKRPKSKKRPN